MVVYCITDLIFATRVKSTADALGVNARPARTADRLQQFLEEEPVEAVIIDLEMENDPVEMIRIAKSEQFSRKCKVIAYAPHVQIDLMKQANEQGADIVMPRGAFTADLPSILSQAMPPKIS